MAKTFRFRTHHKQILADIVTPVSVYLKLRDKYVNSLLLESRDYHAGNNSYSYICCNPIASISVQQGKITKTYPDKSQEQIEINPQVSVTAQISDFSKQFVQDNHNFNFTINGLFGYMNYDAVTHYEDIDLRDKQDDINTPDIYYAVYQNIIVINHFKNEAYIFCHTNQDINNIDEIEQHIDAKNFSTYDFYKQGEVHSNLTDDDFVNLVDKAKQHCERGDVFQLVLSRRFRQGFKGDEFNVYRALRSVNPSPYLFYFDYGNYKIFGSSPEAQLVVNNNKAEIHPIAGTFKRTGNDIQDTQLANKLVEDPKENAEHVMLVDLARNDLSRNGTDVKIENYKEVQFFSHVIHLVSKVTAAVDKKIDTMQIVGDTFPAGTLSGAPKYKAMQLIDEYEKNKRNFYGGAIGVMDFKGNFNHAIMIRTFLSKDYILYYQAGAGIVSESSSQSEMQEVYNKLAALNSALEIAENIQ